MRWVQREILEKDPSAKLRMYAIWLPMLGGDARLRWDDGLMPDPRVIHMWGGSRLTGRWLSEQEGFSLRVTWDV